MQCSLSIVLSPCLDSYLPAAVYPINLNEPHINLYTPKIIGANISLFYYGGFCYMMMRRCAELEYKGRTVKRIRIYSSIQSTSILSKC